MCSRTRRSRCGRTTSLDEKHECPFVRCPACHNSIHQDLKDEHLIYCRGWNSIDTSICLNIETGHISSTVLSRTTRYPSQKGFISTMTAWMTNPENTAIADFEFFKFTSIGEYPCQVAIANGYGNWFVPPTTINHGITKGTLLN
ncbi:hypothetical protein F5Y12DRAFT_767330 [Xylaria sp. FL1777]|nr:hypothetical protein F5Y12DRAFT_767330 [Xylaria sp. FL1777]